MDQAVVGSNPIIHPSFASVVQLDRATDFGSVGWGFESLRTRFLVRVNPTAQNFGRMSELVDEIDLGSIGVSPREGSSPSSPNLIFIIIGHTEFFLKVAVERLEKGRVKLNIEISAETVDQELSQQYRQIRNNIAIPGFRKGKAPISMIRARFSQQIQADILQRLIPSSYDDAIRQEEIIPLGEVDIQPPFDQLELVEGQEFAFSAVVDVKPEVVVPELSSFEINKTAIDVPKEDVDERMKLYQEMHADYIPIEGEREVVEGDCVNISWQSFLDDEPTESEDDADIDMSQSNIFTEIKDSLVGMEVGQSKTVNIDTSKPQEGQAQNPLEGRDVRIEFTLNAVTDKQLPELDDELAKDLDHENYDQFYASVWNEMVDEEKNSRYQEQREDLRQQIVEKIDVEVPEALVERYIQESLSNVQNQLAREGRTAEEANIDLNSMPDQLRQGVIADTKCTWFFEAISDRDNITVKDDELDIEIRRIAEQQNRDPEKYATLLKASNRLDQFRQQMRDEKIYQHLVEHASARPDLIITPT